jgi:hypothetical protein
MTMNPTQKKKARTLVTAYCYNARANEPRIMYDQRRPFPFVDVIGVGWHTLDCSGFVINCFWNAGHDLEVYLADPSGQKYSGYGNTWTMETWLRANGKRITTQGFLVGDIAMYDGHTTVCSKRGTGQSSWWTSHGTEAGPVEVKLAYRTDLHGVWRHPRLL